MSEPEPTLELGSDLPIGLSVADYDPEEARQLVLTQIRTDEARIRLHIYLRRGDVPPWFNVASLVSGLTLVSLAALGWILYQSQSAATIILNALMCAVGAWQLIWLASTRRKTLRALRTVTRDARQLYVDPDRWRNHENIELLRDIEDQLRFAHLWKRAEEVAATRSELAKRYA